MTNPAVGSGPKETNTTRKTTGTNNIPGSATKQPKNGAAYDNTQAPYAGGKDVTGYVGVSPEYRTYADTRNKPLNAAGATNGYALQYEEGEAEALNIDLTGDADQSEELGNQDDSPKKKAPAKKAARKPAAQAPKLHTPSDTGEKPDPKDTDDDPKLGPDGKPVK